MWTDILKSISAKCEFSHPSNNSKIQVAEKELNVGFPDDLKNLLLESNGVLGEYGLGLIWSVEQIQTENLSIRNYKDFKELYMPFDSLLFFADAGNGDQFAYSIQNGMIRKNDIFVWNHEDDSRSWVASDLKSYLEGWLLGNISV